MDAKEARGFVLVTGASSGIGAALAREYARRGHPLVLTARRRDKLDELARELQSQVHCQVIAADLSDPAAPQQLYDETARRGLAVDVLVNNAGYGLPGSFLSQPWLEHTRFLQVMVNAVCELSYRFLPEMQKARRGGIINVASLAGHVPGSAGHTLYAASKAFMIKFSQSLALENATTGVKVSALCPGFTLSEFHDVTGTREQVSKMPPWMWMKADEVAREGIDAFERGEVVHVTGRANRAIKALTKLMPDRMALRMVQKRSKDFRKID
jgi:short-subunit dehydrogenase